MAKKKTSTTTVDTKGDDTKPKKLTIKKITGQEWENVLIIARAKQLTPRNKNESDDSYYVRVSENIKKNANLTINSDTIKKYLNVDGLYSAATNILSNFKLDNDEYIKRPARTKNVTKPYSDTTSKTDIMTSKMRISLKKAGGSRLMSGGLADTSGVFEAALKFVSNSKNGDEFNNGVLESLKSAPLEEIVKDIGSNSIKNLPAKMSEISQAYYQKWVYLRYIDVYKEYMLKLKKPIEQTYVDNFLKNRNSLLKKYMPASDLEALIPSNQYKNIILSHLKADLIQYNPGLFSIYTGVKIKNIDLISNKNNKNNKKIEAILKTQIEDSFIDDAILKTANKVFNDATNKNAEITKQIQTVLNNELHGAIFKKCCLFEAASGVYKFTGSSEMVVTADNESVPTDIIKFSDEGGIIKIPIVNDDVFYTKIGGDPNKIIIRAGFKTNNSTANSILNIMMRGVGVAKPENKLSEYKSIRKRTLFERILEKIVIEHDIKLSKQIFETVLHRKSVNENLFSDIKDAVKNKIKEFIESLKSKIMNTIKYLLNKGLEFFMESFGITVTGTADVNIQF